MLIELFILEANCLIKCLPFNEMAPQMFSLTKEQQLYAGNEIYKLLVSRLNSWDKVMDVVDCKVKFKELDFAEQVTAIDFELILSNTNRLIEG